MVKQTPLSFDEFYETFSFIGSFFTDCFFLF